MARFQKGQSGNPNGRPTNEQSITPLLRKLLKQKRDGGTQAEHIARVLVSMAESGDLNAIKVILDRVDGKVQEHIDMNSDGRMFEPFTFTIMAPDGREVRDETDSEDVMRGVLITDR